MQETGHEKIIADWDASQPVPGLLTRAAAYGVRQAADGRMLVQVADELDRKATELSENVESLMDFFNEQEGVIARMFTTPEQREWFLKTRQYRNMQGRLKSVTQRMKTIIRVLEAE